MIWIIGGIIVWLCAALVVAAICGGRRRFPAPTPPTELDKVYDSREGGWL